MYPLLRHLRADGERPKLVRDRLYVRGVLQSSSDIDALFDHYEMDRGSVQRNSQIANDRVHPQTDRSHSGSGANSGSAVTHNTSEDRTYSDVVRARPTNRNGNTTSHTDSQMDWHNAGSKPSGNAGAASRQQQDTTGNNVKQLRTRDRRPAVTQPAESRNRFKDLTGLVAVPVSPAGATAGSK